MKRLLKHASIVLVVIFLLAQLVPYGRAHRNPPVRQEPAWDSPQTRALAQRACFDCHSNETEWYWYTNIAPISWLTQHDVEEARHKLNFSEMQRRYELDEVTESVREGSMPPFYYTAIHPNARLSDTEVQALEAGLAASLSR